MRGEETRELKRVVDLWLGKGWEERSDEHGLVKPQGEED